MKICLVAVYTVNVLVLQLLCCVACCAVYMYQNNIKTTSMLFGSLSLADVMN